MPKPLLETATITEAAATQAKDTGLLPIQFISPGWGSSGYYSADVIEQAATDQVIPAGTHMYADHPTEAEHEARPVRSIKDLMAVTVGESRIATADDIANWGADPGALVGETRVVPQWRPLIEAVQGEIGTSIRGNGEGRDGEAEGRTGLLVESLAAPVMSVDFVTRAGRGGRVLSLMESAAANHRAIAHGIAEATVNDTREALQNLLRDTHGTGDHPYVWVRDFDDTTVWFEVEDADGSGTYGQTYTEDNGVVTLTGDRTEVRVATSYVPVTRPDSTIPTTEADQEVTMGKIQVEESVHHGLVEKAGRVDALLTESATKDARIAELEEADARRLRNDRALVLVGEAATTTGVTFTALEARGLVADAPVKDGKLDEDAFTTLVTEHATTKKTDAGAGNVHGFGTPLSESGGITWDDIDNLGKEA